MDAELAAIPVPCLRDDFAFLVSITKPQTNIGKQAPFYYSKMMHTIIKS